MREYSQWLSRKELDICGKVRKSQKSRAAVTTQEEDWQMVEIRFVELPRMAVQGRTVMSIAEDEEIRRYATNHTNTYCLAPSGLLSSLAQFGVFAA